MPNWIHLYNPIKPQPMAERPDKARPFRRVEQYRLEFFSGHIHSAKEERNDAKEECLFSSEYHRREFFDFAYASIPRIGRTLSYIPAPLWGAS